MQDRPTDESPSKLNQLMGYMCGRLVGEGDRAEIEFTNALNESLLQII